jgi:hypothetical protein
LEALMETRWPERGKAERVRRALESNERLGKIDYRLPSEMWRRIAEDPDLEEQ